MKAVYLSRSDGMEEISLAGEALVVADSFARMLGRSDDLVSGVYERLFAADPSARALFPEDLSGQKVKLAHALKLAIEGLREPDRIVHILRELGRRHGAYGVTPAHFETLGNALMRQGLSGAGTTVGE